MALRLIKKARRKSLAPALRSNREKLVRWGGAALLLLVCLLHLRAAFLAQLAVSNSANALYFSSDLSDPTALTSLARKEHLANANLPRALKLYTRALEHFVLHVPAWLGLAELYNDMGEKEKAVAALRFVQNFAADTEQSAWNKAMLAHQLDQVEMMTENLVWLAKKFPDKRRQVFVLADQRWPDPDEMMAQFDPSLYPDILEYFISINDVPKTGAAWQRLTAAGRPDQKIVLRYINYLLGLDDVSEAARIWRDHYRQDGSLLDNRKLLEPFLGSGFSWRVSKQEGVSWEQAGSDGGLRIRFAGTDNVPFSLSQIVPLEPGPYILSGMTESQDLTTDQRPYWMINGYKCLGLKVVGEMLPPTGPPSPFALEFTVPDGCHAVQIQLRRSTSYYFDNKISGVATISGLDLVPGTPRQPVAPEPKPEIKVSKPAAPASKTAKPAASKKPKKNNIEIKGMKVY